MKVAKSKPEEIRFNHIDQKIVTLGTFIPFETNDETVVKPVIIINDKKNIWFEIVKDDKHVFKVHGDNYQLNGYPIEMDTMLSLEAFFELFGDNPRENLPIPIDTVIVKQKNITPKKLLNNIQSFLRKYVGLYTIDMKRDNGIYDLLSHWILYTHIYDVWNTCSYLKFMGDFSSGKTIISQAVKVLSFSASSTEGHLSDAAFRREMHTVGGVKLLDEIALSRKDMTTFQNILKSGIQRDATSKTVNINDYKKLDAFRLYCPKVVAGTDCENIDAVSSSRMIEFVMQKAPPKDPVAREDIFSDDARIEGKELRDNLYFFRLFYAHEFLKRKKRIDKTKYFKDSDLSNRFYDIYAPLFTISSYVSGRSITKTLEQAANDQMEMRRVEIYNQLDVPILTILFQQLHLLKEDGFVWLTDKQISNEIISLEVSSRQYFDKKTLTDKYSPTSVGNRIRGMGIAKEHKETEFGLQWKYIKKNVFKIIQQKDLDFSWVAMSRGEKETAVLEAMIELEIIHPLGNYSITIAENVGFPCQTLLKRMEEKKKIKYDNGKWLLIKDAS
jgi:hypothetical protein